VIEFFYHFPSANTEPTTFHPFKKYHIAIHQFCDGNTLEEVMHGHNYLGAHMFRIKSCNSLKKKNDMYACVNVSK